MTIVRKLDPEKAPPVPLDRLFYARVIKEARKQAPGIFDVPELSKLSETRARDAVDEFKKRRIFAWHALDPETSWWSVFLKLEESDGEKAS